MGLFSTISYILKHPLNHKAKASAIWRFVAWQINVRINPYPIIYSFTERSNLIIARGMTGATGNLYCGLHELDDMGFLLHFLREEDLFVDIGANIGSYTVLAAAHVGADVIAIEPVPDTFKKLKANISVNSIHKKVNPLNIALGAVKGEVRFTTDLDTVNHVATQQDRNTQLVPIDLLDELLIDSDKKPSLIKVDVEGFELEVVKGGLKTLDNKQVKALIMELNGSGKRYGISESEIVDILESKGFKSYSYDCKLRVLSEVSNVGYLNTIFIKDFEFVNQRIQSANSFTVLESSM